MPYISETLEFINILLQQISSFFGLVYQFLTITTQEKPWYILIIGIFLLAVVLIVIAVEPILTKKRKNPKYFNSLILFLKLETILLVLVYAPMSTSVTWQQMQNAQGQAFVISAVVGAMVIYWSIFFHIIAWLMGSILTRYLGPNWVKCIDYFYLLGSSLGILRIALSSGDASTLAQVNAFGVNVLGIALSLRLCKTTIEIKGWDRINSNSSSIFSKFTPRSKP
jgi:membrane-associated HD superfamily phosphohydrolase